MVFVTSINVIIKKLLFANLQNTGFKSWLVRISKKVIISQLMISSVVLTQNQAQASEKTLNSTAILIGATAEVGSSDKEGLFEWKFANSVQDVIKQEFGLVQTTSYPAWGVWTGSAQNPKNYNLTATNRVINWAHDNGKNVAIHLISGSGTYFPDWFNNGSWTNEQVEDLLNSWITKIVTDNDNASKVEYWNVVNEAFTWDGKYWPDSTQCRWQQLGWETDQSGLVGDAKVFDKHPVYIRKSFEIARSLTSAKLELRDYYIEFWDNSQKSRAFYQLVKHLINTGVPIDAVGFQGHFRLDFTYDWSKLTQAVMEYKKLGLEVYLTELDYGDTDQIAPAKQSNWSAKMDSIQTSKYHDLVEAAVKGGIDWICLWGVADNSNAYWRMGQNALLFDEQYKAKAAYNGFLQGLLDGLPEVRSNEIVNRIKTSPISYKINGTKIYVDQDIYKKVNIFDVSGKLVAASTIQNNCFDIGHFSQGIHLIQFISNKSESKFIKCNW